MIAVRIREALLFAILLSFVPQSLLNAQDVEPLKFFRNYVGLQEDQITAIRHGKAIAKIVDSRSPDEPFVFGSVYVQSTPDKYLELASDPNELRKLPNCLALRKFSNPPQLSDLEGFTLEPDDIQQLKNCEPGRCNVQLPSDAMDTFKQSVNWSAIGESDRLGSIRELELADCDHRGGRSLHKSAGGHVRSSDGRR